MSGNKKGAAKSSASLLSPLVIVSRLFRGPMRWVMWLGVLLAAVGGSSFTLWKMVEEHVLRDPLYQLSPSQITVTAPPDWIRSDVKSEVIRDAGLDTPASILDDKLAERISQAFALHPWVAKVARVQKFSPARVEVDLIYRKPVCMVEVPGGLYPVDAEAVLLPSIDFSPIEARRYPRLSGVEPVTTSPVGTRWRDTRVSGAAEIAVLLLDDWNELNLHRIVPLTTSSQAEPSFEIYTKPGTRIVWGRTPGHAASSSTGGEVSAVEKLARLKKYFAQNSTLEGTHGPQDLDLRPAKDLLVAPRTASLPER
jgi:hypothetical protein